MRNALGLARVCSFVSVTKKVFTYGNKIVCKKSSLFSINLIKQKKTHTYYTTHFEQVHEQINENFSLIAEITKYD